MSWTLSRFRAGDLVEVRSKEEILATLDERGCVGGMPFMPEMLKYCGRQFRVSAVAHKTCETAYKTYKGRRLSTTVHLAGLRCDGSAHGGCEADCNLFWKDDWLKPAAAGDQSASARHDQEQARGCTEEQLRASTWAPESAADQESCYSCQATMVYDASEPLPWWNPRQYVWDITTGNHSVGRVLRVLWLGSIRYLQSCLPFGYRISKAFTDWMYWILAGRSTPFVQGKIQLGSPTPTGRLNLKPGEYVRVKLQAEIEKTLDQASRNRGLSFDGEEMAPYCGRVFKVRASVTQILDEVTGKMLKMKQPCIILDGVVCTSQYSSCRLNCPRAFPSYWRELWLERVEQPAEEQHDGECEQGVGASPSGNGALVGTGSHECSGQGAVGAGRIGLEVVGASNAV